MYLDDIKLLLTGETNIFISSCPDTPDNLCFLNPYSSNAPDITMDNNIIRYPKFQVLVRSTSFTDAWSRIESIFDILNAQDNIISIDDPISIGKDDKKRSQVTCNFRIIL